MIVYIDETENDEYFIVSGIVFDSKTEADNIYKIFKHKILNYRIPENLRAELFTEFKSFILDTRYQRIKHKMLELINLSKSIIIYSVYLKKERVMKQSLKEKIYIKAAGLIIENIHSEIDVIFDGFSNKRFEQNIISSLKRYPNVKEVCAEDSQKIPGLQIIDNICSIIRRHISGNDKNEFYKYIKDKVKEIKIKN